MKSYHFFTNYYDSIVRGNGYSLDDEVDMIDEFIKNYLDKKVQVEILEVACGTGVVARELLRRGYNVLGVDLSEEMLEKAVENVGEERCFLADMRNFELNRKFDVVLCNYNSICHLVTLGDWRKFFLNAYNHLNKGGLLIFDINTVYEFDSITRDFAQFFNFENIDERKGKDVVCLEMSKKQIKKTTINIHEENYYYRWLVKMFIQSSDGRYDLIEETIDENSFEIDLIKNELSCFGFDVLHLEDFHNGIVSKESERVYFICKKN